MCVESEVRRQPYLGGVVAGVPEGVAGSRASTMITSRIIIKLMKKYYEDKEIIIDIISYLCI